MFQLTFYNTEKRAKILFEPQQALEVKLYTCGPTVYDFAHIGNFRTYVFEDLLRRTLFYFGYHVTQVMNLTDVDDKTLRGAIAKNISLEEYTRPYIEAFFADLQALGIERAEYYPAATEYIPQMVEIIRSLLDQDVAYKGADGSIYFSIRKFPKYGRLSHLHLDELKTGASQRVASDEYDKENVSDFVLWKIYDPERDGSIYWDSPFGKGRPGWHIECSAMAMALLGQTIDIHVGAVDNIFPHHENEIAQSEACTHKPFVKYWLHSEHLIVDGKKMSKSLGNFYTLRDLLKQGYTGREVRYMLLQTHYRTQLNFTTTGLQAAKSSLKRFDDFIDRLTTELFPEKGSEDALPLLERASFQFHQSFADDLNLPQALAALFDLLRDINTLCDQKKISAHEAKIALDALKDFDRVLGVLFTLKGDAIPQNVQDLAEKRQEARKAKNWQLADQYRDQITTLGYIVEDKPTGIRITKKDRQ